ncbi:hypothetical protein SERLA73DRAFT_183293 [Serpula lacrymans var. lacrymans S7.3]|uniref:Uncharacterized protein n=1 Tax=Serpula lacrymans var. lacrymans (strain S7.3) TaxID=936435 RepID=F8PZL6_SERL3|nr:hypothetical protein SERLA73DRAFT_183293 [Serpula lacrymans var. lacrymans S7.3]
MTGLLFEVLVYILLPCKKTAWTTGEWWVFFYLLKPQTFLSFPRTWWYSQLLLQNRFGYFPSPFSSGSYACSMASPSFLSNTYGPLYVDLHIHDNSFPERVS